MEFAKYYNVSKIVEKMQETEEIGCYPSIKRMFMCEN